LQIEVNYRTGGAVADAWGADPDLRAECKMKISEAIVRVLRTRDLIEWRVERTADGDTVIRGIVSVEPGHDPVDYILELNPKAI
jgi:hypothetical protein